MAGYKLLVKASATIELGAVPRKDRQCIVTRIRALADEPRPHRCEKLSATAKYRIRQADYRIVYGVGDDDRVVTIVKMRHRRDVYR